MAVLACRYNKVVVKLNKIHFGKLTKVCRPSKSGDIPQRLIIFEVTTGFYSSMNIFDRSYYVPHKQRVHFQY